MVVSLVERVAGARGDEAGIDGLCAARFEGEMMEAVEEGFELFVLYFVCLSHYCKMSVLVLSFTLVLC